MLVGCPPRRQTVASRQRSEFEMLPFIPCDALQNTSKHRPTRAYDKEQARESCMQHLLARLESKSPRLVFCLGNAAVQTLPYFLEDWEFLVSEC